MTVTQDILTLIHKVDSYDDLRTIGNAINARGRALQGAHAQKQVADKSITLGCPVSFMVSGRKVYGTVKTINPKTCTVDVPGTRGYRVPPQMLTREAGLPAPAAKRTEDEILEEINGVYGGLSPENLTCDGELPRHQVERKSRELHAQLEVLFKELGRRVSEHESFEWWMKKNGRAV